MATDMLLYENIEYGAYALDYSDNYILSENVKYNIAEFNKLYTRSIRLPDGTGNLVYILSDSFDNVINLISSGNFIIPPSYRKIFYPQISFGSFMGRRYRFNVMNENSNRKKIIMSKTKLRPYGLRKINNNKENLFFACSDLFTAFKPIISSRPVQRSMKEFYPDFIEALNSFTPSPNEKGSDRDNHRVLIIDADKFSFKGGSLNDNKSNPLFLLYLAYMRLRDLSIFQVDLDMVICSKNLFIKFNPKNMTRSNYPVFKRALFRIMNVNLDDYTAKLSKEEKSEIEDSVEDKTVSAVIDKAIEPFVNHNSPSTKAAVEDTVKSAFRAKVATIRKVDKEIKKAQDGTTLKPTEPKTIQDLFTKSLEPKSFIHQNPAVNPLTKKQEELFKRIGGDQYSPLAKFSGIMVDDDYDPSEYIEDEDENEDPKITSETDQEGIETDATELINDESVKEAIDDEIQENIVPLKNIKTAPVNSARDQKLREEQKKIVVKDSSIEEILARDVKNIPIETEDKSAVMHTTNQNMKQIRFANFDKTYIDNLYTKDIVSCFDMLKDKENPFYITNIEVHDTSDSMNLKETWTVSLVDETNKKHTIKVDIPKFQNDRFMIFKGTKRIIPKQNMYNPLVKDTPDTVILTTNLFKVTISRYSTKSMSTVSRIFSLIKKTGDTKVFISGDSSKGNLQYISSLEYDELSKKLFKYESNGCVIYFSRNYIDSNISDQIPKDIKGDEFFIGFEGKTPILINEDTGLDRSGRTIADIIEQNLSDDYKSIFNAIKAPTQLMYVECKLAGQFIPIIVALMSWIGLTKTLDRMGMKWEFHPGIKKLPNPNPANRYIRFADGLLEYEGKTYAELVLNGMAQLKPEKFNFEAFNSDEGYGPFVYSKWGSYNGLNELKTFYEFLVDPITEDVCRDLCLPTDAPGLLIHAVKLLSDNAFVSKACDNSYRVRSIEMIPAILYSCIVNQYKKYVASGRRLPMTLKQDCVIAKLKAEKTVKSYSTLNPVVEIAETHSISTKGYRGSNSDHSYDEEKRSYDPSAVGKIAISTSADANVGVNKSLVIEPTISNARGYREQVEDIEALKDVNLFSPVEMYTPGTVRNEDPIRTAIACKQSQHIVPVEDAMPALVSNGFDEAIQFHLSDDFVINAEEDGKVIDVNNDLGFVVVKYTSGKTKVISTSPEIVHNSGGGFFMANRLVPVHTKVGEKFKKDEVLAYHPNYFHYSKINGLRSTIGPLTKVAICSTYNTYEDAGICTETLSERLKTSIVYQVNGAFKRNNNIISMVKIGDEVEVGDSLIKFDVSVEENELAKYLSKLSEESANLLEEETKSDIKTNHAGKVIAIKVYTLLDPSNLSPSLSQVVQDYFDKGNSKKEYLEQFDHSEGIIKGGYMLTDNTEPVKDQYHAIKGNKGIDVLIEIYIEHEDVAGVGDKIALYSANKQIISEVIPKGYEPYSEFRPDEEISVLTSPGTIARRMTPAMIAISAATKCLIELKRKIKEEIKYG